MNRYTPTMIWLLGCLLICLVNLRCSGVVEKVPIVRVPTKITSYPLRDYKGIMHKYTDNFDSFVFPQDNNKLTQYCAFHMEWENIRVVYRKRREKSNKLGKRQAKWVWEYIVTKHKRHN